MSLFAIVTFDLHKSASHKPAKKDYDQIAAGFARLKLKKEIRSARSGKLSQLTYNTYAAKFKGKGHGKATKVRNRLRKRIKAVISAVIGGRNLKARVFIFVGRRWAWSRRDL
jgi:hypothetical protein